MRPLEHVGLDERPRAVADRRDRLGLLEERADEGDRVLVHAQEVGVGDAAREHEPVVVGRRRPPRPSCRPSNVSPLSRWLNAWISPESVEISSGVPPALLDRLPRLGQLHLLHALGRDQERDLLAVELVAMSASFRSGPPIAYRRAGARRPWPDGRRRRPPWVAPSTWATSSRSSSCCSSWRASSPSSSSTPPKGGGRAGPEDPGAEGSPAGIAAPDASPLGDTDRARRRAPGGRDGRRARRRRAARRSDDKPRVGDPGPEAPTARSPSPSGSPTALAEPGTHRLVWEPRARGEISRCRSRGCPPLFRPAGKRTLLLIDRGARGRLGCLTAVPGTPATVRALPRARVAA